MKNKGNMQPTVNPKPIKVQRVRIKTGDTFETVIFRNVSVTPQELIKQSQ